jgi:hypothetical protein
VGLGVDCTAVEVAVLHPTDETAPDLPPQPLLLVRAPTVPFLRTCMHGEVTRGPRAACLILERLP